MSDRVVAFLDYQNVYMRARGAFHERSDPSPGGQIDPLALGELLAAAGPFDRHLDHVRVYRGHPEPTRDERGNSAFTRQVEAWQHPQVVGNYRPLLYPRHEKPREKGIDVALAIDFVTMAVRGEYDVGILFSTDTDLIPALEAVITLPEEHRRRVEVAAWSRGGRGSRLSIPGEKLWCHWLDADAYKQVHDPRNYARP